MFFRKRLTALICMLSVVAGTSAAADPQPVTVSFVAQVTEITDTMGQLNGKLKVGDLVDGRYTYDRATRPSQPVGTYKAAYGMKSLPSSITLKTGAGLFRTLPELVDLRVYVTNDEPFNGGKLDEFYLLSVRNSLPIHTPHIGNWYNLIEIYFSDETGLPLESTQLPAGALELEQWQTANVMATSAGGGHTIGFVAKIISVENVID